MKRPTSRILSAAIASTAVIGMLTAPAAFAQDETGPGSAACTEATTAHTEGQSAAEAEESAAAALATARADVQALIALPEYAEVGAGLSVDTATVADVEVALEYLRGLRGTEYADDNPINGHMDTLKALREALNGHATAAEAAAGINVAALAAAMNEACAEPADNSNDDQQNDDADADQDARTDEDLDCADFPLADGRTAQQVLDADPSDPHRLDADDDGRACEVDENEDTTNPGDTNQQGDTTTGGDSNTTAGAGDDTSGVYYENCAAAREAGAAPLYTTVDDGYRAGLDSDGDGVACEGGTLYNGSGDFSQTGDVPIGSAETGAA